ncbi:MAG: condensation domain-containing protein, partial [Myxococcota bacterium]
PIANTPVHVLDPELRPVPIGVDGELWIGGRGVAQGYLGRPELTADRFRPVGGERLYRTGDRVRLREDGSLLFLGRVDDQIKLRGHRIEPAEIEVALGEVPGAGAVAVALRTDRGGHPCLVAWFTGPIGVEALRARARAVLPEVMVPSAVHRVSSLPLSPSGKVDRAALVHQPADEAPIRAGDAPLHQVASAFAAALGRAEVDVDVDASCFELGGQSLSAVDVAVALRAHDPDLPVDVVFRHPTVAGLAAHLGERVRATATGPAPGQPPTLSLAQAQLWFLHHLAPPSLYHHAFLLRLRGRRPGLAGDLTRALATLLDRHEALRTGFVAEGGRPRAVVHPRVEAPLVAVDLSGLAPHARESALVRDAADRQATAFDLERPPLLSMVHYTLDAEDHGLLLVVHHLVWDGASAGVFGRELTALLSDPDADLPPLPWQYADFAAWQRRRFEDAGPELAFWREELPPAPPLALVPDRPAPATPSWVGASAEARLPGSLVADLAELGRREGATLFMVLLAALQVLLAEHTHQDDVRVGVPVADRTAGSAALVGYFVNVVVMRGDLAGDPSFAALVRRTRDRALRAMAHQDLPFPRLLDALAPDRTESSPLFQAMLVLQDRHEAPLRVPGLEVHRQRLDEPWARYDVTLELEPDGDGLHARLTVPADRFDRATARRWTDQLVALLGVAARAPTTPIRSLVPRDQPAPAPAPVFPDAPLHALFLDQAAARPDAPAVVHAGRVVSYAELRDEAAAVAAAVSSTGSPGPVLAIVDPHELPAAMLGALIAGRAVVAVEPEVTDARLATLVADARPATVLTGRRAADRAGLALSG